MAFVSQITHARGKRHETPGMSVKFSKSGSTSCYIGVAIRAGLGFIEVELDEVTKQVRARATEDVGAKMTGSAGGQFSLQKSFGRKVIPHGLEKTFIELEPQSDGWWYGKYGQ